MILSFTVEGLKHQMLFNVSPLRKSNSAGEPDSIASVPGAEEATPGGTAAARLTPHRRDEGERCPGPAEAARRAERGDCCKHGELPRPAPGTRCRCRGCPSRLPVRGAAAGAAPPVPGLPSPATTNLAMRAPPSNGRFGVAEQRAARRGSLSLGRRRPRRAGRRELAALRARCDGGAACEVTAAAGSPGPPLPSSAQLCPAGTILAVPPACSEPLRSRRKAFVPVYCPALPGSAPRATGK